MEDSSLKRREKIIPRRFNSMFEEDPGAGVFKEMKDQFAYL